MVSPVSMMLHYLMNRRSIRIFFIFMLACLPLHIFAADKQQQEIFNINSPLHPPAVTKQHDGFEDLLAIELFSRMGLKPEINIVPAERGLKNLNQGIDDAILTRVAGLSKLYPNIVRITEVANERKYIAFARKDIKIKSWADLKNYDVAYISGWKIFNKNVTEYHSLTKVRDPEQLFYLLDKNRADVVLYGLAAGQWMIKKLGLENIKPVYPPLANKKKYFYLHKKHTHLVPIADETLREIKDDGTYDKLKKLTLTIHH